MIKSWQKQNNKHNWAKELRFIQVLINKTHHPGINCKPYDAMFDSTNNVPKHTQFDMLADCGGTRAPSTFKSVTDATKHSTFTVHNSMLKPIMVKQEDTTLMSDATQEVTMPMPATVKQEVDNTEWNLGEVVKELRTEVTKRARTEALEQSICAYEVKEEVEEITITDEPLTKYLRKRRSNSGNR